MGFAVAITVSSALLRVGNTEIYVYHRIQDCVLARLRRDHPDLAAKVVSGELSANKAAQLAGFRTKTVSVPLSSRTAEASQSACAATLA
jgi:hypothetical protein